MNEQHEVDPDETTETDELDMSADLDLSAELEKARGEAAAARDLALRAQAELENFRKRMRREMEEDRRYAEQSLLSDLLPVLDNIGRAAAAAESTKDVTSLLAGVKMVQQQLEEVLRKHHALRIEADGAEFDPHLHQAISMQPNADLPPGSVVLVAQEGYQLHDRVLRPSQVIVSTAAE
ncbi:MAG: nucleotide exchange factor GrpE [Pirellulales bacterium]